MKPIHLPPAARSSDTCIVFYNLIHVTLNEICVRSKSINGKEWKSFHQLVNPVLIDSGTFSTMPWGQYPWYHGSVTVLKLPGVRWHTTLTGTMIRTKNTWTQIINYLTPCSSYNACQPQNLWARGWYCLFVWILIKIFAIYSKTTTRINSPPKSHLWSRHTMTSSDALSPPDCLICLPEHHLALVT